MNIQSNEGSGEAASARLVGLLNTWVDEAFPNRALHEAELEQMWLKLAMLLVAGGPAGTQGMRLEPFIREATAKRESGHAGAAPTEALRERIQILATQGMREYFLVLSARQALDYLIHEHFVAQYPSWQRLADHLLPISLLTELSTGEATFGIAYGTFGPGQRAKHFKGPS